METPAKKLIQLDPHTAQPIHLQIYHRFKAAIESNLLKDGDRIPSTRTLASELDVARGTVESAYAMLLGEGVFESRGQSGTYVCSQLRKAATKQLRTMATPAPERASQPANLELAPSISHVYLPGCPAFDAFPRKVWARLSGHRMRSLSAEEMRLKEPQGYTPLRQSIAAYLRLARGVVCEPEQIFITNGYQGALDFLSKVLKFQGESIWMEDPGFLLAAMLLKDLGANIVHVPIDEEGLIVSAGIAQCPQAKLAIVTPSHHSPLGLTLSAARRMQLLEWASQHDAWVIEDDYDGEFRYSGYPLPSLKSLDQYDRVIYAGSFSKTIFPSLKIGYIVVPPGLVDACQEKAFIYQRGFSITTQMVVNDFITEGHFSRHLKKMRDLYAHRRELTSQALVDVLEPHIQVSSHKNGMHFVAALDKQYADTQVCAGFNQLGYGIHPISTWSVGAAHNGLIIGFTNVANRKVAEETALKLKHSFLAA
ncbi:MocR-like pyridoxine biosynthesis transcription factor PdxR [Methylophilus sp.]|uniref:MocR-like pyridoxine biosynthesis transcription factor PdxR n=1 Tax=Methylophilus sp. TaxID=29541 RepID=UPI0040366DFD